VARCKTGGGGKDGRGGYAGKEGSLKGPLRKKKGNPRTLNCSAAEQLTKKRGR